ncbi:MAG: hypothetical protein IT425_12015 [Pirellulales bacterium]|nr:hypothetical protein [Pirellulales bacterium]
MLNKIWFGLLCIGLLYGFGKAAYHSTNRWLNPPVAGGAQQPANPTSTNDKSPSAEVAPDPGLVGVGKKLNTAIVDAAKASVEICIGLVGIMAVWLGLLNIAKDAGLLEAFARALRPALRWLFPEVPDGHPAQGAILMNLSANMLGLDNAATPLGLKAMNELQKLNPVKDTAMNSMAMFLAINNSSVTLIPFTLIGYRVIKGSTDPARPLGGILLVTTFSTIVAILVAKWLAGRTKYRVSHDPTPTSEPNTAGGSADA